MSSNMETKKELMGQNSLLSYDHRSMPLNFSPVKYTEYVVRDYIYTYVSSIPNGIRRSERKRFVFSLIRRHNGLGDALLCRIEMMNIKKAKYVPLQRAVISVRLLFLQSCTSFVQYISCGNSPWKRNCGIDTAHCLFTRNR